MKELSYDTDRALSSEQLSFIENALVASYNVSDLRLDGTQLRMSVSIAESDGDIRKMIRRLLFISKTIETDVVFRNDVAPQYELNPQPFLEEVGDVQPISPGFFTLQGDFLKVFRAVNELVLSIANSLGAVEQEYPTVWPVRLFKGIDYFHEFPQQVILCSPVKDDFESRREFASRYSKSEDFESVEMTDLMADAEYGLEPAVCDCCYYGLEGQTVPDETYYTCYNKVFRNERSPSGDLDRLTNFSVRDIMFVGVDAFVLEARQILIERLSELLHSLRLRSRIETANDPFFANDSLMKSVFQSSHRLKYELLAEIPHKSTDIAVGSINFHQDFFGKAFDIRTEDSKNAFSGCIGVGMERMTYALFCQHGPEVANWPYEVVSYLGLKVS